MNGKIHSSGIAAETCAMNEAMQHQKNANYGVKTNPEGSLISVMIGVKSNHIGNQTDKMSVTVTTMTHAAAIFAITPDVQMTAPHVPTLKAPQCNASALGGFHH